MGTYLRPTTAADSSQKSRMKLRRIQRPFHENEIVDLKSSAFFVPRPHISRAGRRLAVPTRWSMRLLCLISVLSVWLLMFLGDRQPDTIKRRDEKSPYLGSSNLGSAYTNPSILSNGCALTVLLMDPRIPQSPPGSDVWYALESMASNVPRSSTCVILQTSSCTMNPHNDRTALYEWIQTASMPKFQSMIQVGNVRVKILNHTRYKLGSCYNFYDPSRLFMNPDYWGPVEFDEHDSDLVLMMQTDSVLCHYLDPEKWRDVAYVGAPWPPDAMTHNNPGPPGGACRFITEAWNRWTRPDRKIPWHAKFAHVSEGIPPHSPLPPIHHSPIPLPPHDPPFMNNACPSGVAPVGNGGLTLRSREWIRRAIGTCPHVLFSGLPVSSGCRVYDDGIAEDLYFATVLNGIGAPMPTPFEASLFSTEMIGPEDVIRYYHKDATQEELERFVERRWGVPEDEKDDLETYGVDKYRGMREEGRTVISMGMHKPWWYHAPSVIQSEHVKDVCPFLEHILPNSWTAEYEAIARIVKIKLMICGKNCWV